MARRDVAPPDWPGGPIPPLRLEAHWGERVVPCFSERPGSLHGLLEHALRANGAGEGLVCGEERLSWAEVAARAGSVAAGLAAREVFQLLAGAGYPSLAWFGIAFTVGLVLDSAAAPLIDPNGGVLLAVGFVLAAVGAFTRPDPRDGLPTWFANPHPAVLGRHHVPWGVDETIACGGTTVQPGDVIVGDGDGLLVIPPGLLRELVAESWGAEITVNVHPASIYVGALGAALFARDNLRAGRALAPLRAEPMAAVAAVEGAA